MRHYITDSWMPTSEGINTLPDPLRRYIRDLQADVDPAEGMRENFRLRREIVMLKKELAGKGSQRKPVCYSCTMDLFYFGSSRP